MSKVIGIDLGTTNSCVAVYEAGEAKIISNKEGKSTTPSIVAFTDKGDILVGEPAKRQAIKRIMGLMMDEKHTKDAIDKVGYKIINRNGAAAVEIAGKTYTPQEISAKILLKLKTDAETYLGSTVTDAVITVPAYFNDAQRKATQEAGTIAGLNVLRIINEPTSAALAYGLDKKGEEKVIVYDLGGGTFDVTILEIGDGTFEVLATDGNAFLGGDDFDNVIIDWLAEDFKTEFGIDLREDKMAHQRLKDEAEKAKKELSATTETEINLPFITADATGPKHLVKSLTRAKFEAMTEKLVDETLSHIKNAMSDAELDNSDINEIIMVGGSTRIPKTQEVVKSYFGKELNNSVNPDEVVAAGAAIQGGVLKGDVKDVLLLDVTPLSLGIETLGGVMTKLIDKGTTIPVKKSQVFSTAQDNQPAVSIVVGQGEREFIKDNKNLGQFELSDIAPAPKGQPQIEVTFDIDANGVLNVSAKDKSTGKENKITISGSSGLSDDEIEKMVNEAEANKEADKKKKEIVDARNQAEAMLHETRKSLEENKGVLAQEIEQGIIDEAAKLEELIKKEDATKEELDEGSKKLAEVSQKLMEEVMQKGANAGGANPAGADASKKKKDDDDIIDAEVE